MGSVAPASASTGSTIVGEVLGPDGLPLPAGYVLVDLYGTSYMDGTDASSRFEITGVPAGSYDLRFVYMGAENILDEWWSDAYDRYDATKIVVDGSSTFTFDAQLATGGTISGSITGPGGAPIEGPQISVETLSSGVVAPTPAQFPTPTTFVISKVAPGSYVLKFSGRFDLWVPEWWNNKSTRASANTVVVALSENLAGVNVELAPHSSISGTLLLPGGIPAANVSVTAEQVGGSGGGSTVTDSDGNYVITPIVPGNYIVGIHDFTPQQVIPEFYGGPTRESAAVISVPSNTAVEGIDFDVAQGGVVAGYIHYALSPSSSSMPLYTAAWKLFRVNPNGSRTLVVDRRILDTAGSIETAPIEPGTYILEAWDTDSSFDPYLAREYWDEAVYAHTATRIELDAGERFDVGTIVLEPKEIIELFRIEGPDRFGTSADIAYNAADNLESPLPVVYIANGLNYPDALAAGPAAAVQGGLLLLVTKDSIPTPVADALDDLRPEKIIVVGSTAAVSDAVKAQLGAYSSQVVRIGGADRYQTAERIVRDAFGDRDVHDAFVVTGANFPDALTAGPAAAQLGGPILLVYGPSATVSDSTLDLIDDLGIEELHIAGSSTAVSNGISSQLGSALGGASHVHRYAGSNRYETGVLMNQAIFSTSDYVFVATGSNFADALGGGPFAAAYQSPLYLSTPDCMPIAVYNEVLLQRAQGVVVLGSTAALSDNVLHLNPCL